MKESLRGGMMMLNQVKKDNQDVAAIERMCVLVIGLCLCQQMNE